MKKIVFIVLCICLIQVCFGQKSTSITGKVIDQDLNTLPGVELRVGDSIIATTNLNGEFKIELDREVKKVTFMFAGLEQTPIVFDSECKKLEIVMLYSGGDCFATLKKNDKMRKKIFDKIPSIYRQAYEKGIFEYDKPCGEIQFISWLKSVNKPSP
ncbi:hypothetical protein [Flavobacterium sp.]|uniref:hypothetical protein n=1 Tax=Flavobacterium sp. TaxID=239 RepID=UPI003919A537